MDSDYSKDGANKGYQKNRSGEHAVYKYISGGADIERTTLICFLLFFASDAEMPKEHELTCERLNEILNNCGFAMLKDEDDFDCFVIEFIEQKMSRSLLMQEVNAYARIHENSFLYHIYDDNGTGSSL